MARQVTRFASHSPFLLFAITLATFAGCGHEPASPGPDPAVDAAEKPAVAVEATPAPEPLPLDADERAAGWIRLFDGSTLYGWQPAGKANWQVRDGAITVSEGEVGLLCTTTRFVDYELKLEFKADKGTNSGVFLRTPLNPSDPSVDCYELNIAPPDNPFPTGSLVARSKHELKSESTGWQNFHVTVSGGEITAVFSCNPQATLSNYAAQSVEVQGHWAGAGAAVKPFVPMKIRAGGGSWEDVNCATMH